MRISDRLETALRGPLRQALIGVVMLASISCSNATPEDEPVVVTNRHRAGGTDITFFVTADTHFGYENLANVNRLQIEAMNALPGTADAFGSGVVAKPLGVLIAGDLTDHGTKSEWRQFVSHYGLDGSDGLLKYPVFEATGNHDRWREDEKPVLAGVRKRHGGLNYSWDWGDVHMVCADESPSGETLRWLKRDLASVGREMPIIIYFHFSITGSYSGSWDDDEKDAFKKALEGFNVVGIFHGHHHISEQREWEGYDVYNVGAPKHSFLSFAVVHITDTEMTVASWDWRSKRWRWSHRKKINEDSTTMPAPLPSSLPHLKPEV